MPLPWTATIGETGGGPCLLMEPNGRDADPRALTVQGEDVQGVSGAKFLDKTGALPQTRYEWQWICETREQLRALRDFFDARRGRYEPFWFPTWERPFKIANYYDGGVDFGIGMWAETNQYTRQVWSVGPAYRRIICFYGATYQAFRIKTVTPDSPTPGIDYLFVMDDGGTGGVGITLPRPWPESTGVIPIALAYGRFDTDDFECEHVGDGGIVTLPILELPDEVTEPA